MRKIIAIDVDDVLAESAANFVNYSNHRWGTGLEVDDYDENWAKIWDVDYETAKIRAFEYLNSGVVRSFDHKIDSVDALKVLSNDYRLIVVTSRNSFLRQDTIDWVKERYGDIFNENDIYFSGIWDDGISDKAINHSKGEILAKLGANYLVDDQPKHCLGAASYGIKSFLFGNYGWNNGIETSENIIRVSGWQDLMNKLEHIEKVVCD